MHMSIHTCTLQPTILYSTQYINIDTLVLCISICTCINERLIGFTTAELKLNGSEDFGAVLLSPAKTWSTLTLQAAEYIIPQDLSTALEDFLKKTYRADYPSKVSMPHIITKYKRLKLFGRDLGSELWNRGKGKHVLSRFIRSIPSGRRNRESLVGTMWPGFVKYYFSVELIMTNDQGVRYEQTHRFAWCSWYTVSQHAPELSDSVWTVSTFAGRGTDGIIPLYAIASEFVPAPIRPNGDFVILTLPNQITVWSPDEYEYDDDN